MEQLHAAVEALLSVPMLGTERGGKLALFGLGKGFYSKPSPDCSSHMAKGRWHVLNFLQHLSSGSAERSFQWSVSQGERNKKQRSLSAIRTPSAEPYTGESLAQGTVRGWQWAELGTEAQPHLQNIMGQPQTGEISAKPSNACPPSIWSCQHLPGWELSFKAPL